MDLVWRDRDVVVPEAVQAGEHVGEHGRVEARVLVACPLQQGVSAESGCEVVDVGEVATFGSSEECECLARGKIVVRERGSEDRVSWRLLGWRISAEIDDQAFSVLSAMSSHTNSR